MQLAHTGRSTALARGQSSSSRLLLRSPAPAGSRSRARNVQVVAKGKGKGRMRNMMPQQGAPNMQQQQAMVPDIDPDNEEFAIFVRIVNPTALQPAGWAGPVTVVKGGQQANLLVQAMRSPWGKALYSKTLIKNIAQAIYQDKDSAVKAMRRVDTFKNVPAKDFVFGFKIRDKNDKNAVLKPDNITELPSEEALGGTPIDDFKRFWSPDNISTMFGGAAGSVAVPDSTPANTQQ